MPCMVFLWVWESRSFKNFWLAPITTAAAHQLRVNISSVRGLDLGVLSGVDEEMMKVAPEAMTSYTWIFQICKISAFW